MASSTGKKGGKKIGRTLRSPSHARYIAEDHYNRNRKRDIKKHLARHPEDKVALKCLGRLK